MSKFYRNLRRNVLALVPGSVANVAQAKRQRERELRAQGMSKRAAMIEASKRLSTPSKESRDVAQ